MIVQLKTIEELKREFLISFRNNCGDKVTKVMPNSVINGFAYGISKLVQKINRDAASIESKLFPEYANSTLLDEISQREGVPERNVASKSTALLLFIADENTVYSLGTQVKSANGVTFTTLSELTIDANGFGFVFAESSLAGINQNVEANSINIMVSLPPIGHESVTNPVRTIGGADIESDFNYKYRILNAQNIFSKNTNAFYEALVRNFDSNVLRVISRNVNRIDNRFEMILVKNSGADFNSNELNNIKTQIKDYLPYSDYGDNTIILSNVTWQYIDIYAPIKLESGYVLSDILKQMQINVVNYLDMNSWEFGKKVDWDVLLQLCYNVEGVRDIDDVSFIPNTDIIVSGFSLPRLRDFTIKDLVSNTIIGRTDTPVSWLYRKENVYDIKYII